VPSFNQVYELLQVKGPGEPCQAGEQSTELTPRMEVSLAFPRKGRVTIYRDCWGESITCQGTRAGGVYNGPIASMIGTEII